MKQYKIHENELRNTLDFDNMMFSNFLNLNKTTILDFKKKIMNIQDIFISFNDEKENIVYAKKGNILMKIINIIFNYQMVLKLVLIKNKQIEKLEFLNYVLKIENKNIKKWRIN